VRRKRTLSNQRRSLEAVHIGHMDVEQNRRELVAQDRMERIAG
jgi:hypothetical protein